MIKKKEKNSKEMPHKHMEKAPNVLAMKCKNAKQNFTDICPVLEPLLLRKPKPARNGDLIMPIIPAPVWLTDKFYCEFGVSLDCTVRSCLKKQSKF